MSVAFIFAGLIVLGGTPHWGGWVLLGIGAILAYLAGEVEWRHENEAESGRGGRLRQQATNERSHA